MWHLIQVTRGAKGWFGGFETSLNERLVEHLNDFEQKNGRILHVVQLDHTDQYANILVETNNEGKIYERDKQGN